MIDLACRNLAAAALLHQISNTGAHYLARVKNPRRFPEHHVLADGTHLSAPAGRVLRAP